MDAVYEGLKNIMPDIEAHEVANKFNRLDEVATKADLETALAKQETKLIKQMYAVAGVILAGVSIIVTAVGLVLKFL